VSSGEPKYLNGFDQLPGSMIGIEIIRVKVRIMRRHVEIVGGDRSYALQRARSEERARK